MRGKIVLFIAIVLGVALMSSLVGVGVLAMGNDDKTKAIAAWQAREQTLKGNISALTGQNDYLNSRVASLNSQVAGLKSDLTNERQSSAAKDKNIADLNNQVTQLTSDRAALATRLRGMECGQTMDRATVSSVATDQGLIDPLTKAVESDYGETFVQTTYDVLWSDSKSAVFTLLGKGNASVKVAVSWDFNTPSTVSGVYNINQACWYYEP
jgi:cell division protein FtsB